MGNIAFTVVIPARFGSTRFPGKPLADIVGKPMIQHVCERAAEAGAEKIIVATDDERIADVASAFARVSMTSAHHHSGTERIAEVIALEDMADDTLIVNVQGDEPFVPADNIRQVATNLANDDTAMMSTLCTPIHLADEVANPNVVKVVTDERHRAMYFSRSVIPYDRERMLTAGGQPDPVNYFRHIGLYAYRAGYVRRYVGYAPTSLEQLESLEQLRALWYGDAIHCAVADAAPPVGIDTPDDLTRLVAEISRRK